MGIFQHISKIQGSVITNQLDPGYKKVPTTILDYPRLMARSLSLPAQNCLLP
ncbi:MAG: hypothetical protein RID53_00190 [Coleofasciculus sp. B1-GNL1-01]